MIFASVLRILSDLGAHFLTIPHTKFEGLTADQTTMAQGLSAKEKASVRRAFQTFDTDGSGSIELSELLSVFKILGLHSLNSEELTEQFKKVRQIGVACCMPRW